MNLLLRYRCTIFCTFALVTFPSIIYVQNTTSYQKPDSDNIWEEWKNGIDLFDLVMISRHISGISALGSPYRIISADVDNSRQMTMSDVVLLRDVLLNKRSRIEEQVPWRYIRADYRFPDPANPFKEDFPEVAESSRSTIPFVALRMGDVNSSHVSDSHMKPAVSFPVSVGQPSHQAGEFTTFPISYEGDKALTAIQLGLQFDADNWELLEPSTADLPDYEPGCFNLREVGKGQIKFIWFTPLEKEQLQKGRTLFYLTFRRKTSANAPLMLHTDDEILASTGLGASGQPYNIHMKEALGQRDQTSDISASPAWTVDCSPNPVTDAAHLRIQSPSEQAISIWVFNALGIRTYYREMYIAAGGTEVSIPEAAQWPAGIYTWKVKSGKQKRQGQFVRL